jgi:cysteine synthase A
MSLLDMIGNKPMINLEGVWVKLEYLNPSGSVKDRIAKYIVEKAERSGELKKGYTIIEATSGNTGIAFSMVAAIRGYKMIAVMPRGMSEERMEIMKAYGAKVVYVKKDCFGCAIDTAKRLGQKKGTFLPRQFDNPWNPEEHEKNMGPEILKAVGKVDAFVAGVGTGGTVVGVGHAIKKKFPKAKIFALEPDESPLMALSGIGKTYGGMPHTRKCKHHGIEGIGDGIIPDIISDNRNILDGIVEIKTNDAIKEAQRLAKLGYLVGPSSGANFLAAKKLRKEYKNVVTLFPDSGDRYLSEGIFN